MITSVLAPIFVIGVLVLFHELGHFLVAKWSGIRVEAFSIGFGRAICSFQKGDTTYKVAWIPFGGYVKMSGEDPDDSGCDEPWRFHKKSVPVRSAVILAGPIANLITAVLLYAFIFSIYGIPVTTSTEIGAVIPDSPAAIAGLQGGDTILEVAGVQVENFEEVSERIEGLMGGIIPLSVLRQGETIALSLDLPEGTSVGVVAESESRVGNVIMGGPADRAGIRRGDRITAINAVPLTRWSELRALLAGVASEEVEVAWNRDGENMLATVTPDRVEEPGPDGTVVQTAKLQITQYQEMKRLGPIAALDEGAKQTWYVVENVFAFLKIVLTGNASRDMVGGPVQIFQVSSQQAKEGFDKLLLLMAFLSVQLGILNLLPIPVLDGGHMVFLAAEAIRRKPLSVTQRTVLQQIGMIVILGLMVTVTVFDVGRLLR